MVVPPAPGAAVTTPRLTSIVATNVLVLVHVPPPVVSVNVDVNPAQIVVLPLIAGGSGLTVTVAIAPHPVPAVRVITAVPPATPVTTPVPASIVATAVFPLLQVPAVASVNAEAKPGQTTRLPEIDEGVGFTVTVMFVLHPVSNVYVMIDVPAAPVVTTPDDDPMTATLVLPLSQLPPPASVNVDTEPGQRLVTPEIEDGSGLTVNVVVVLHPFKAAVNVIVAVPAETPVTVPVTRLAVAMPVLLLVHVPRPDASLNVLPELTQAAVVPRIEEGAASTVTTVVATFVPPAL